MRGTQRDPARRFQSAREMAEELDRVLVPEAVAGRRRFITSASPAVPSMTPPVVTPPARQSPSFGPDVADLKLTTGQRSVVSRSSPGTAPPPERESSVALLALLVVGALIVLGVVAFAVGGGARALHQADRAKREVAPAAEPAPTLLVAPAVQPPTPSATASASPALVAPR